MFNWIRKQDLFATPVNLSYKGGRAFRTVLGGICSIIFIAAVATLFTVNIWNLNVSPTFRESQTHSFLVEK